MEFRVWSELNNDAKLSLRPDMGFRNWDSLKKDEKSQMWKYLENYFFDLNLKYDMGNHYYKYSDDRKFYYPFYNPNEIEKRERVSYAIVQMFYNYRVKNYTPHFLEGKIHFNACIDFYNIFMGNDGNAVFELLSFYCKALLNERKDQYYSLPTEYESEEAYKQAKKNWEMDDFLVFAKNLNEIFTDYGIEVHLTSTGFIPRQDNKIITEIIEPVLKCLTGEKWKEVNNILNDAFSEFRKNTPNGFSSCITHVVSAVQAFLQIMVNGQIGTGDISKLVIQAQNAQLLPSDSFSRQIFKNIEGILMKERQETGDAHPKKDYANQKNAKLALNLAMVFIQHSLTD